MRQLAGLREEDAEIGVHRIFKEHGLVPDVNISAVDLGYPKLTRFPVIKVRDWLQCLLNSGQLWRQMVGCSSYEKMTLVLREFWVRMKQVRPSLGVYKLASEGLVDLEACIPYYSHSDEGRSLKKQPLFVLSIHGVLGRGTSQYLQLGRHRAPLLRNAMGMNFVNAPMASHFTYACFLKAESDKHPGSLDKLVSLFNEDVQTLLQDGITSQDMTKQIWFCHLGTKGDLPALSKLGGMKRNFLRAPKAKASKKPAIGICHRCLAGQEQLSADGTTNDSLYPYEDVGARPAWLNTLGQEVPWDSLPNILRGLDWGDEPKADFFCIDLWHCFHLGLAKHWVGSALVSIVEYLEIPNTTSVEQKFAWLTTVYREFCRGHGSSGWVKTIDRDFLNWPSSSVCPIGSWNKGSVSTHLMYFLEWFCSSYITGKSDHQVLVAIDPYLVFFSFSLFFEKPFLVNCIQKPIQDLVLST